MLSENLSCRSSLGNMMWDYLFTFFAVLILDIVNTYYLQSINNHKPFLASFWAVIVTFVSAYAIINYTTNHMMLIPALLGAFVGTYIAMKCTKK